MVERAAMDYSKILNSVDPTRELKPICANIDDMLARLDEFESLLSNVKSETRSIMEHHINAIVGFGGNFATLCERIDKLEYFVEGVNTNLCEIERSVDIAEEELGVTGFVKSVLLRPLLAKTKPTDAADAAGRSNLVDGELQQVPIFKTENYFGDCVANP